MIALTFINHSPLPPPPAPSHLHCFVRYLEGADALHGAFCDIMHLFFAGMSRYEFCWLMELLVALGILTWAQLNARLKSMQTSRGHKIPELSPPKNSSNKAKGSLSMTLTSSEMMHLVIIRHICIYLHTHMCLRTQVCALTMVSLLFHSVAAIEPLFDECEDGGAAARAEPAWASWLAHYELAVFCMQHSVKPNDGAHLRKLAADWKLAFSKVKPPLPASHILLSCSPVCALTWSLTSI
jgi:hypothetical protein